MLGEDRASALAVRDAAGPGGAGLADAAVSIARALRRVPWVLCLIVAAAAALRFTSLDDVPGNHFYDAAVRSMTLSWHNFFFGAFDPSAFLSVDKAPLDLWLQVASVKLFGFGNGALKLPEALAGTLAVPLVYDAVRRVAGSAAGLGAAAALGLLPESVLTSRSDTMDSVMMLFIIAALWLLVRAVQTGRRAPVVLAGAVLGLAFNVKLFEALVPAPALFTFYLLASGRAARRRLEDLALAAGALVAVGLSWATVASLAPGRHPWPIGSTDGSVWNVMFVFNGFGRVSSGAVSRKPGGPGLLRLLQSNSWQYDKLFGCALIAALALGGVAVLAIWWRRSEHSRRFRIRAQAAPRGPVLSTAPPRAAVALAIATSVWVLVSYAVFSHAPIVHTRYLESAAPGVALAIGFGAASLCGLVPWRAAGRVPSVTALALALAGVCAYLFVLRPVSIAWGAVALGVAALGAALLTGVGARPGRLAQWLTLSLVVATAVVYPVHESVKVVRTNASNSLGLLTYPLSYEAALSDYLQPRTAGIRYELVADEPIALSPLIIRDHRPIVPLTSFKGIRAVGLSELKAYVAAGQVRYALISAHLCSSATDRNPACTPAAQWVRRTGVDVSADAGIHGGHRLYLLLPSA